MCFLGLQYCLQVMQLLLLLLQIFLRLVILLNRDTLKQSLTRVSLENIEQKSLREWPVDI